MHSEDDSLRPEAAAGGSAGRPPVSVIVPFAGGEHEASAVVEALGALALREGDELFVVDNDPRGAGLSAAAAAGIRAIAATGRASSYHARNAGARRSRGEWLLFLDADCRPLPALIDAYFARPISVRCGAVAGGVRHLPGRDALLVRYASSRGFLDQAAFLANPGRPYAATANLLVRRAAWAEVGGFCEVRSGGDVDFSWRLQDAGWSLELREEAWVEHRHRERLGELLRQRARYAAGHRWLARRHPGGLPRPRVARGVAKAARDALTSAIRGRGEDARFRALDALALLAHVAGGLTTNEPRRRDAGQNLPARR